MPPTSTDNLVLELVAGLTPAPPLWRPQTRALVWVISSLAVVSGEVWYMRGRGMSFTVAASLPSAASAVAIAVICSVAAVASFYAAVPGRELTGLPRRLIAVAISLWVVIQAWALAAEPAAPVWDLPSRLAGGEGCFLLIAAFAAVPTLLAYGMLRRGAPLSPARCGALALLAGACMGALGMQLICPSQEAMHLLVWHVIPTLGLGAAGFVAGRFLLRW